MAKGFGLDVPWRLSALTAVLSNIVSNVPAVLVAEAVHPEPCPIRTRAWLVVAMTSTLAGNLTLLGSVANLIVAERARAEGAPIGFWAYFKVGLPLTLVTLAAGTRPRELATARFERRAVPTPGRRRRPARALACAFFRLRRRLGRVRRICIQGRSRKGCLRHRGSGNVRSGEAYFALKRKELTSR